MLGYFDNMKREISQTLTQYIESRREQLAQIRIFGETVPDTILDFTLPGKMIRGGLLTLSHEMFGGNRAPAARAFAAAMELIQTAFLIHDDIMDRDLLRRGQPSVFYRFKLWSDTQSVADSYRLGESLGICAGDISFFMAFELMSRFPECASAMNACTRILTKVALAQMQDVLYGSSAMLPDLSAVYELYMNKTGTYTFSMPMVAGAIIAGKTEEECATLVDAGENMGVLFQLRDDELGIFGDEIQTGKPVGSDIREGKKDSDLSGTASKMR